MPAKHLLRVTDEGSYLHIYNKGVENRLIFNDSQDYEVFTGYLRDYLSTPTDPESRKQEFTVKGRTFRGTPHQTKNYYNRIELVAYNLSPNHFHLVLHQIAQGVSERFIRSLCTRYSMYFNKKYQRTGSLFEGSYKSVQISNPTQLLHLTTYLHKAHAEAKYSSHPEYSGTRDTAWVTPRHVLGSIKEGQSYRDFAEKYELGEKEMAMLEGITVERPEIKTIEKEIPQAITPVLEPVQSVPSGKKASHSPRIPEYFAISGIFVVLLSIGLININTSKAQNSELPLVLSATTAPAPTELPLPLATSEPTPAVALEASLSGVLSASKSAPLIQIASESAVISPVETASPSVATNTLVVVKIADGSPSVNIRSKPTLSSESAYKAYEGETFEFLSKHQLSGWYEIKLVDGTTGFISPKYSYLKKL